MVSSGVASLDHILGDDGYADTGDTSADAIYITGGPGMVSGNTITGSYDGVWVDAASGVSVMNNIIKGSAQYGIALTSEPPVYSNNNKITGNFVLGSSVDDLYWDGLGTGDVWCHNIYQTSSPSVLPSC